MVRLVNALIETMCLKLNPWLARATGPELDKTLGLRNFMTYSMGREAGLYSPAVKYVEVFRVDDGKPLSMENYAGVYLATEKIKRDKNRVNIEKMDDEDPSGGYIFAYDNDNFDWDELTVGPLNGFVNPFVVKEPDAFIDDGQFLIRYLEDFQASLKRIGDGGEAVSVDRSYTDYIDLDSAIDYFLLVEMTKNPDAYRGSTYMFKDKGDGKIGFIPWDYNEAYGMCCGYPIEGYYNRGVSGPGISGGSAISEEGWRFNICEDPERCQVDPSDGISFWFVSMWKDPSFRNATSERWNELRQTVWSDNAVEKLFDDAVGALDEGPALRNTERYVDILYPNGDAPATVDTSIWKFNVESMKTWLFGRLAWMDEALTAPVQV